MTPAASVCIPVYNGERFLASAVASVLAQTFEDYELIVVDNASSDATVAVVRSFDDPRLRLVEADEHVPAADNWNRASALCRGRYVKLLCADDALAPTCLERQVEALERHPAASMAASLRDIVDDGGRPLLRARGLAGMDGFVAGPEAMARSVRSGTNGFGEPASVLMRGEALRAAGPWTAALPYMIDLDLYFRLLARGGLVAIQESLAIFRVHTSSWSTSVSRRQAKQAVALFAQWRGRPGSAITRRDMLVGTGRAHGLRLARRLVYSRPFRVVQDRRSGGLRSRACPSPRSSDAA